jgi:hypothetical protein
MQAKVTGGVGAIGLSLVSAVITSLIAKRVLPAQARLISAGAFSETINCGLAQTPVAPFLAGVPRRFATPVTVASRGGVLPQRRSGQSAWPIGGARSGVSAWPMARSAGMPIGVGGM